MTARAAASGAADAEVLLYFARIGSIGAQQGRDLLADDDLARLASLTHARRRAEYLTSRALLRLALERYTGRPAKSQRLRTGRNGKPECVEGPAVSVSHSGDLVVCALAPAGRIGVDIQTASPRRRADDIARQYFSECEHDWIRSGSHERFYMLWVLKEAYLKATGFGLAGGLDALDCRIQPPIIEARTADSSEPVLALYEVGSSFLGIATLGCRFTAVQVACSATTGAEAPLPLRLVAASQ